MKYDISDLAIYLNKYISSGTMLRLMLILAVVGVVLPDGFWYGILKGIPLVAGLAYAIVLDDSLTPPPEELDMDNPEA